MEKKEDVAAALALALFLSLSLHPDRALSHPTPAPLRRALEGRDLARHDGEGEAQHRAEATGHAALFATQLSSRRSSLRGAALFAAQLSSRRSSFFFLSLGRRFVVLFFLRLTSLFPLLHLHSLAKQKTQNTMNLLLLGAVGLPVGYLAYGYAYLFVPPK
jgi:hypothetical protein